MDKETQQTIEPAAANHSVEGATMSSSSGLAGRVFNLQHAAGNQAVLGLLNARLNGSNGHASGRRRVPLSAQSLSTGGLTIQRSPNGRDAETASGATSAPAEKTQAGGLIVE